ncbi:MAG: hypothetical protein PQJ59_16725 [Spirochaetales bacterium]|nr:hypothetical protein [Spirochaetales bacterium]
MGQVTLDKEEYDKLKAGYDIYIALNQGEVAGIHKVESISNIDNIYEINVVTWSEKYSENFTAHVDKAIKDKAKDMACEMVKETTKRATSLAIDNDHLKNRLKVEIEERVYWKENDFRNVAAKEELKEELASYVGLKGALKCLFGGSK